MLPEHSNGVGQGEGRTQAAKALDIIDAVVEDRGPVGGLSAVRSFYDLLFRWGAVVYAVGFFVCLFGSWYWAGYFDIAHVAIALFWPLLLILFVLGALYQRYYG